MAQTVEVAMKRSYAIQFTLWSPQNGHSRGILNHKRYNSLTVAIAALDVVLKRERKKRINTWSTTYCVVSVD